MTMHLERLRDDVRQSMGFYLAESTIDDQAIDNALRHALRFGAQYAPLVTKTITLIAEGRAQDISSLIQDIARVMDVRYPYDPAWPTANTYPCDILSNGVIQFKYGMPAIGDTVLIVGRPHYTLTGLNGTADTLPEHLDLPFASIAAAHILRVEGFRHATTEVPQQGKTQNRASGGDTSLALAAKSMEQQAIDMFYAIEPVRQNPAWGAAL
jgi:hypothetical protein